MRCASIIGPALAVSFAGLALAEDGGAFVSVSGVKTLKPPPGVIYVPSEPALEAKAAPDVTPGVSDVVVGQPMPPQYMVLFNATRLGLPPPRDGWVYFEAGEEIYRVNFVSRTVLENVTDQAKPRK